MLCGRIESGRSSHEPRLRNLGVNPAYGPKSSDAHGGLAVDLGLVAGDDLGVVGAEELARDREAAEALDLGDPGLLQQVQRSTARADEDEAGEHALGRAAHELLEIELPESVLAAADVRDLVAGVERASVADHVIEQLVGEGAEVDVRAGRDAGRRVGPTACRALLHQQGGPLVDRLDALRELHAGEEGLVLQRLVALAEVLDVGLAVHERHVRSGVDEARGLADRAGLDEARPELARDLELLVDLDRLGGVDGAVGRLGHVVQLAEGGVARAGVVPGVRGLLRDVAEPLVGGDRPVGLERGQEGSERGAHDAPSDEGDVDRFRGVHEN